MGLTLETIGSLPGVSELRSEEVAHLAEPTEPPSIYFNARRELATHFLFGEGLEIGPLHQPLEMPSQARARYVDRMQVDDLRREYPELREWNLTQVDIVDDGESLSTIAAESQDFIVANHFLEHCENPIRTIETHLGKLKPGGILFYAVPDKRFTFDFRRPVTPLAHMVDDYERGPEQSRGAHYDEWTRLVIDRESPVADQNDLGALEEWAAQKARELEEAKYSIHMHVWTQAEFLDLILDCRKRFGGSFDIEATARQGIEFMVLLRKHGPLPPPNTISTTPLKTRALSKLRRGVQAIRRRRAS
jgi:SAM-dependent methyltransferase